MNYKLSNPTDRPTRYSYRVEDNFWGGEYPIDIDPQKAVEKLGSIVKFGITDFVDLTEEGELRPYQEMLPETVNYTRFPIRDGSIPKTFQQMDQILERIDQALMDPNRKVYVHCWGGVGRTGTVIACYYVRHGKNVGEALAALRQVFTMNEKSQWRIIPENYSQEDFIRQYDQRIHANS